MGLVLLLFACSEPAATTTTPAETTTEATHPAYPYDTHFGAALAVALFDMTAEEVEILCTDIGGVGVYSELQKMGIAWTGPPWDNKRADIILHHHC